MSRLLLSAGMVAREILRNRTAIALLFLVPTVLYILIYVTTGDRSIPFRLRTPGDAEQLGLERPISLLFMGSTAMCGLLAFLAFVLTWRPIQTDRRLVFEGYQPWELLGAKVLVIIGTAALVALYVTALLLLFHEPQRVGGVWLGFFLGGSAYGLLGIAIGTVSRRDLDGILAILLLVNIDPGWLQNPVFYAHAHNRELIHWLPAHHPCQVTMLSGLTLEPLGGEIFSSVVWLGTLGCVAALCYRVRLGIIRRHST